MASQGLGQTSLTPLRLAIVNDRAKASNLLRFQSRASRCRSAGNAKFLALQNRQDLWMLFYQRISIATRRLQRLYTLSDSTSDDTSVCSIAIEMGLMRLQRIDHILGFNQQMQIPTNLTETWNLLSASPIDWSSISGLLNRTSYMASIDVPFNYTVKPIFFTDYPSLFRFSNFQTFPAKPVLVFTVWKMSWNPIGMTFRKLSKIRRMVSRLVLRKPLVILAICGGVMLARVVLYFWPVYSCRTRCFR